MLSIRQVNSSGTVVRTEILGAVKMKCYLSGMPELRLGLNDKVMFDATGRSASFLPTSASLCYRQLTAKPHSGAREGY